MKFVDQQENVRRQVQDASPLQKSERDREMHASVVSILNWITPVAHKGISSNIQWMVPMLRSAASNANTACQEAPKKSQTWNKSNAMYAWNEVK